MEALAADRRRRGSFADENTDPRRVNGAYCGRIQSRLKPARASVHRGSPLAVSTGARGPVQPVNCMQIEAMTMMGTQMTWTTERIALLRACESIRHSHFLAALSL